LGANYVITGQLGYSGIAYRFRVYAIDIARGTRITSTSADIRDNDRQLAYFLGGNPGGSAGPVVSRQDKWFQFSVGGGVIGNCWFMKYANTKWTEEFVVGEFGIFGGLSVEFFSYILLDVSPYYKLDTDPGYDIYGDSWNWFGLDFSLYGKYSFQISQKTDLYPLVGLGYDVILFRKNKYGTGYYAPGWEELNSLYLRIGGDLNYDFSQHLRFNAKLLYNIFIYSEEASGWTEYSKHGPGLSLGLSYVF